MPGWRCIELADGGQERRGGRAGWVAGFLRRCREHARDGALRHPAPGRARGSGCGRTCGPHRRAGSHVRLLYNVDSNRPPAIQPPPSTRPELLHELPIEDRGVPGIPDLMHHKYVVRDAIAVWTGSANWTTDSWTRQENVVVAVDSAPLAAAYAANFEELWERRDVERSGRVDPRPGRARRRRDRARRGSRPGTARRCHRRSRRRSRARGGGCGSPRR